MNRWLFACSLALALALMPKYSFADEVSLDELLDLCVPDSGQNSNLEAAADPDPPKKTCCTSTGTGKCKDGTAVSAEKKSCKTKETEAREAANDAAIQVMTSDCKSKGGIASTSTEVTCEAPTSGAGAEAEVSPK